MLSAQIEDKFLTYFIAKTALTSVELRKFTRQYSQVPYDTENAKNCTCAYNQLLYRTSV